MKKVAWIVGILTIVGAGGYVVIYLNRWEWNRAQFSLGVLVAAEVGVAAALILRKLGQVHQDVQDLLESKREPEPAVLARLEETRPQPNRFAWLKESAGRTNVFVTMLMGGGLLVSVLAWVLDKVGGRTLSASGERQLARQLGVISFPDGGFVADEATLLAEALPYCDDPELRLLVGDTAER